MPCSSRTGGPRCRALASMILIALCLLPAPCADADDATSLLPLLREQRHEADERERQLRLRQLTAPTAINAPAEATASTSASDRCWPISAVRLAGNTLISAKALNRVLEPLLQPCMDEARINAVLKAITRAYLEQGYLAARPYLANAPAAGASLDIVIVEGFAESVEFDDPDLPLSLSRAFPDLVGLPLTLAALEQGLNQMNRLQAFDLSADLEPGELQGGTRVVIRSQRKPASRWRLDTRYENLGDEQSISERLSLTLSIDSPLGHNDRLVLRNNQSLPSGFADQTIHSLTYQTPYGPWDLNLYVARGEFGSRQPGGLRSSKGESDLYGLGLDRALWHNASAALNASIRLNYSRMDSRLSIHKQQLRLQSPTLTRLETSLNLTWHDEALWSATLAYSRGLGWFGSDDRAASPHSPDPLFDRYQANLWRRGQGTNPAFLWRWDSELNLQYSPVPLFATEQMPLSDESAVRGFRSATVSGASGAVWRNTFSLPLTPSLPLPLEIRPSVGFDAGWSRYDHGSPSQGLLGAHAGLQLSVTGGRLRIDYHRALHASGLRRQDLEPGYWLAELNLTF
ncbi:ShlB/FhaC/HecB family hemolysin secretion/activation protein [Pseudomonas huaxiensis]|uniref:ShlB/FhaC/HecB family hemolysin secretion/activation protein n=1 Tax=Pseudomonas huaxiensis TaxID=2213017 RepID=UPI000DA6D068|nr:ShlB/FhaC/HecB family hemolysin secretion/activation protein [Pseudomonas huaxiensis]